jgi:hypothetical protein
MPRVRWSFAALLFSLPFGALLSSGCDSAPGLTDDSARPALASVVVTPLQDSLETSASFATIPLIVTGVVSSETPVTVRALVRYSEADTLVAEARLVAQAGSFRLDVPLTLPRGAIGSYAVTVSTEGANGRAGDEAAAVFTFKAASLGPPTLTLQVASSVTRRSTGSVSLPIVATVTDPDGRANIAFVLLQAPNGGGVLGPLYDEGRTSRSTDERANDGRYTAGLSIPSTAQTGPYTFEVIAVDRAGQESAPVPFTFTVQ